MRCRSFRTMSFDERVDDRIGAGYVTVTQMLPSGPRANAGRDAVADR